MGVLQREMIGRVVVRVGPQTERLRSPVVPAFDPVSERRYQAARQETCHGAIAS